MWKQQFSRMLCTSSLQTDLEDFDLAISTVHQDRNMISCCWCGMCVRLNLYPEWHALLSAVLLCCEFSADAVNFDGNFCFYLWSRIPDKLNTVQLMRVDLHIKQATAQRDIYTSLQHTPSRCYLTRQFYQVWQKPIWMICYSCSKNELLNKANSRSRVGKGGWKGEVKTSKVTGKLCEGPLSFRVTRPPAEHTFCTLRASQLTNSSLASPWIYSVVTGLPTHSAGGPD